MDRFRQKTKKDKPMKHAEKEKSPMFTDVKTIKENLKIKEILRSVKMNNSMRIKAPRGSVVMDKNEFTDVQEDGSDDHSDLQDTKPDDDLQEAKNFDIVNNLLHESKNPNTHLQNEISTNTEQQPEPYQDNLQLAHDTDYNNHSTQDTEMSASKVECMREPDVNQENLKSEESASKPDSLQTKTHIVKNRERKLSLDNTMLTRRESLSQSEMDLHSIGKSPLERKSSFFRKKMDSFLKNTTEIFKRQSLGSKSHSMSRRGSMSVSLQSLNENVDTVGDEYNRSALSQQEVRGSAASVASNSTLGVSERDSAGSQPVLSASQPSVVHRQGSPTSTNGAYNQDSLLNSRAISMSSGLDSAFGQRRRKTSKSNRVTWVASEGLTNYLRRSTQDETSREMYAAHSYQDFSSIPENSLHEPKTDSKGRRLSYQRAVSGEDPAPRYDSSLKRKPLIPEHSEANFELSNQLAEFTRNGVPPLEGFEFTDNDQPHYRYLLWAEERTNIDGVYDWTQLSPNEEARQAVIRELISTEADYLRHLISLVQVFMAAAHALQDSGRMLAVDTARLFSNIPDVLNASLAFWEATFYPMLQDAHENGTPYNTEFMSNGFGHFREIMQPYERYVNDQTKVLDYFRTLSNNSDFMAYLGWCHGHRTCNRLQLADLMVKPMQRLTKYGILLRRIISHTDAEPERTSLKIMETNAKNYVLDINRTIRQREELERLEQLANSIDVFDVDFRDEDMDRYFRMYSHINLRAPMVNCLPSHSRTIIYQGDLRYRDNVKEIDVRVILLTDMMLICKKMSKGSVYPFKLIRPKYMVDRMIHFPRYSTRNPRELASLIFVMVDEVGSSYHSFSLSEPAKDPNPQGTLKIWEQKLREARLTYDLGVWFARNPSRDLSEVDVDSSSDYGAAGTSSAKASKQNSDDVNIEREARERVAAMLHRSMGASTEYDFSQASMNTDSFDGEASGAAGASGRAPTLHSLRHPMQRNSTSGSSRQSRLSSFQYSTSAASHDEPQPGPSRCNYYRAGSSVEHVIPPQNPDDAVTSITVNVVSESESETVVPSHQQPGPSVRLPLRSPSATAAHNTLRVQPQSGVLALVHSLPDLTIDPSSPPARPAPPPTPQTASEKLYQSHQELLQRNRLSATHHHQYLSPDHRGTSYPPPSPTRAALRRGMAFSDSFKYPPLSKMGHVNSQSQQQQAEPQPGPSTSAAVRSEQGAVNPVIVPSTGTEKEKKSKHLISSRNKGGSKSESASGRRKDKQAE
ncbi:uncharacterized protein LOC133517165 isoform X1 [Cydia pomonella]|uniref:uncharacterized protein LOC133517165 isoform X1 n=1 Tax=Cydia pomonella TaxID=82600 RepID=UPI002ADDDEFB|nr:uncharacterized protein LOC133517165 isoform X1 [Cydia pomonella]